MRARYAPKCSKSIFSWVTEPIELKFSPNDCYVPTLLTSQFQLDRFSHSGENRFRALGSVAGSHRARIASLILSACNGHSVKILARSVQPFRRKETSSVLERSEFTSERPDRAQIVRLRLHSTPLDEICNKIRKKNNPECNFIAGWICISQYKDLSAKTRIRAKLNRP